METTNVSNKQYTDKQLAKGEKGILDITSTLGQVLKQLSGKGKTVLPETDGMTPDDWFAAHGVVREVKPDGKLAPLSPKVIREAWHPSMKVLVEGKEMISTFKTVKAVYKVGKKTVDVYATEQDAIAGENAISRYLLRPMLSNKWTMRMLLNAFKQKREFPKHEAKNIDADLKWEEYEHLYIREIKTVDGVTIIVAREVARKDVKFNK